MPIWQLHMLNARGALTPIMAEIRAHAREVVALVEDHLDLPRFDLVVRAGDGVIPEWGIGGHAPAPGIIELMLDPARVAPEHFRRTLVHEMHHLARWEGPGYGRSLGEALVTEGLAGHFVLQVLGGPADPWDQVRPGTGVLKQAATGWARRDHDHGDWFMGRGRMRKWTGYGLGHRIVAEHLTEGGDAAALVHAPADDFRQALRRLMATEAVEEPAAEHFGPPAPDSASRDAGGPAPRTPPAGTGPEPEGR
ncbi:peptidase [Paracoccus aestuarii]|uniref:Peptidase n=1 Tax=Paracoccus aestuarii TaxID=453842 RepID=A0A418ZQY7_9RHOB|nr:DUF2268 domain-containing putative Zn-dependent protease [Paracoccus aestuarii]RJK98796.1 peptidase [Paracoccus aestuarii]WCQ99394.1 hypothetical protein JHW48_01140 [Paracoccus aestuarii]